VRIVDRALSYPRPTAATLLFDGLASTDLHVRMYWAMGRSSRVSSAPSVPSGLSLSTANKQTEIEVELEMYRLGAFSATNRKPAIANPTHPAANGAPLSATKLGQSPQILLSPAVAVTVAVAVRCTGGREIPVARTGQTKVGSTSRLHISASQVQSISTPSFVCPTRPPAIGSVAVSDAVPAPLPTLPRIPASLEPLLSNSLHNNNNMPHDGGGAWQIVHRGLRHAWSLAVHLDAEGFLTGSRVGVGGQSPLWSE
jgi:hypothetical protein